MSNQDKKSLIKVTVTEYKLITFFTTLFIAIPILIEVILLADLLRYDNMSQINKLLVLVEVSEFNFTNTGFLSVISLLLFIVMGIVLPLVIARKLNGQRLLTSIQDGFKDLGSSRTWNFIVKVYVPYIVILILAVLAVKLIPNDIYKSFILDIINATGVSFAYILALIIISVIVTTITSIIVVANITYMRGSARINEAFNLIKNKAICKLLLFNIIESMVVVLVSWGFLVFAFNLKFVTLLSNAIIIYSVYLVFLIICQIIFVFLRLSLYMSVASQVDLTNNLEVVEGQNKVEKTKKEKGPKKKFNFKFKKPSSNIEEIEVKATSIDSGERQQSQGLIMQPKRKALQLKSNRSKKQPKRTIK